MPSLRNKAYISTRNTPGISHSRSYRTLRDGSFEGRFSQALRARLRSVSSLRDALADISLQHLASMAVIVRAAFGASAQNGSFALPRFFA